MIRIYGFFNKTNTLLIVARALSGWVSSILTEFNHNADINEMRAYKGKMYFQLPV